MSQRKSLNERKAMDNGTEAEEIEAEIERRGRE
jgi:hypothetical protein